jgi:hypothetical protein
MSVRTLSLIAVAGLLGGCFSPEVDTETETEGGDDSGSSSGGSTGVVTGNNPATSSPGTTGDPTESTTSTPTTDDPSTTDPGTTDDAGTTDDPSAGVSTGEDPFCGDGNVDPGEECDDGLDNNGLDQACLPDCNLNVCGDGNLAPNEVCDDGEDDNVLEVGACAPDCSTIVQEKIIQLGDSIPDGDLGNNPVATADGTCPVGYRALFAHGNTRRATTSAYEVVDPVDWVLSPWTFYTRSSGDLIWATDAVALLGVRDGAAQDLENSVYFLDAAGTDEQVVTGLEGDWTTAVSSTCDGWSSTTASLRPGNPVETSHPQFLRQGQTTSCADLTVCPGFPQVCSSVTNFYCVEQ